MLDASGHAVCVNGHGQGGLITPLRLVVAILGQGKGARSSVICATVIFSSGIGKMSANSARKWRQCAKTGAKSHDRRMDDVIKSSNTVV
jgi:hypothetical protein